jgi:hypothetical protein
MKAAPILTTLLKIQHKYQKDYSWPAQLKILELMGCYQGIVKSRATLNRWLAAAQEKKYLIRRRRIILHPAHGMIFKSTLYKITIKGYRLLASMGVMVSNEIQKYLNWREESKPRRETGFVKPTNDQGYRSEVATIIKKMMHGLSIDFSI